ncbi:glycosyltransferase family 2 protein [Aquipseudomonas alcaligenes]|uniref:glycosyltransferase family 2 protein n=1 Tax=Aquipseudomonas alcaligenes TaxID=43263 RepID=UPI0037478842
MNGSVEVSVLLPVYNGAPYIREALESILAQDHPSFEVIVINDGSTDDTATILEQYTDPRLRVIHQENAGLAVTLHRGVELAHGQFVARQDADDISQPGRLSLQHQFLVERPDFGLVGTWSRIMVDEEVTERRHTHPTSNGELQMWQVFDNFFVHTAVMFRRDVALQAGNYPLEPEYYPPEDFYLWSRIARFSRIGNIDKELVVYREVPGSISRAKADLIDTRVRMMAVANLRFWLGEKYDDEALSDLVHIVRLSESKLSHDCKWQRMLEIIRTLEECVIARFPEDAADIRIATSVFRRRLWRIRLLKNRFLGRGLRIAKRLTRAVLPG